jgi:hypothetical protein
VEKPPDFCRPRILIRKKRKRGEFYFPLSSGGRSVVDQTSAFEHIKNRKLAPAEKKAAEKKIGERD